jgi:histidinol dehydrogenase
MTGSFFEMQGKRENNPAHHPRGADSEALVYPVISRRTGGLSLGINLYPEKKTCTFDCPYCEVEDFLGHTKFALKDLAAALDRFLLDEYPDRWSKMPILDISISGNGEPTMSPLLGDVLTLCSKKRRSFSAISKTPIVLITNSTGFLKPRTVSLLRDFNNREGLTIWAKLDAGSQELFEIMSGSLYSLDEICEAISEFSRETPIVVQTMLCTRGEEFPSPADAKSYAGRIADMLKAGAKIEALHLYTVSRKPNKPTFASIPARMIVEYMEEVRSRIIQSLKEFFPATENVKIPVISGFDERGIIRTVAQ